MNYGYNIGAEALPRRSGLLAAVAPVLAPATGGMTAKIELDAKQHLHAAICVDGKCYQTSIDLAPAIAAVMAKIAQAHADMHASMPTQISGDVAIGAIDEAVGAASDALIGALVDRHISVACAGWLDDIGNALSSAGSSVYHGVADTVKALKGPITTAAVAAATAAGGPIGGLAASQLVGPILDTATSLDNKDTPQKAAAEQAAKTNPQVAQALAKAKEAVAHTVAAYHVTETAKKAAAGHPGAQQEIAKVTQDAERGDPVAHAATDLIANAFSTAIQARKRAVPAPSYQTAPTAYRPAPAAAPYQTAPAARPAAPGAYRQTASRAVARAQQQYQQQSSGGAAPPALGYLRADRHQKVYFFNSPEEAQGWYAALAPGYSYAAWFDARNLSAPVAENFGGTGTTTSGVGAWQEIIGPVAGW